MGKTFEVRARSWLATLSGVIVLGAAVWGTAQAAPVAQQGAAAPVTTSAKLRAQLKDVDAKIVAAHARHAALQSQMAGLERQNAAQQRQVRQRDAEIAALQQKLQVAGAPAPAGSAGH